MFYEALYNSFEVELSRLEYEGWWNLNLNFEIKFQIFKLKFEFKI